MAWMIVEGCGILAMLSMYKSWSCICLMQWLCNDTRRNELLGVRRSDAIEPTLLQNAPQSSVNVSMETTCWNHCQYKHCEH